MNKPLSEPSVPDIGDQISVMQSAFDRLHAASRNAGPFSVAQRKDLLQRARHLLVEHHAEICEALNADFGCRSVQQSLMGDIYSTVETLKYAEKHVESWAKPVKAPVGFPLNLMGARAHVEYQAKGVVGNLSTWNFPVHVAMAPLAGIFAAGNRAMIKMSEGAPHSAALMVELIKSTFSDEECVAIDGEADVAQAFCALDLDHLIFTGSGGIGAQVMATAAQKLTPVTLELGGKSPVILSRSCDRREALLRTLTGKMLNVGQACIGPDYLLVPDNWLELVLADIQEIFAELYPSMVNNPDYGAIINERHFNRLFEYIREAENAGIQVIQVNPAGDSLAAARDKRKLPLTLLVNPPAHIKAMQEEIFGPIFCIIPYKDVADAVAYINHRPRPLALYYFGTDKQEERFVLDRTCAGSVAINDVMAQISIDSLPFGGIGASGMGAYHGKAGFETCSHAKPVYHQSRFNLMKLGKLLPPYSAQSEKTLLKMIGKK